MTNYGLIILTFSRQEFEFWDKRLHPIDCHNGGQNFPAEGRTLSRVIFFAQVKLGTYSFGVRIFFSAKYEYFSKVRIFW